MDDIIFSLYTSLKKSFPFAIYCKPGGTKVTGVFQRNNLTHNIDFAKEGFVFAPFSGKDTLFIPFNETDIIHADFTINPDIENDGEIKVNYDADTKLMFEKLVLKAVSYIKECEVTKIVVSRKEKVLAKTDLATLYNKSLHTYPNAFRYIFYHPMSGIWIGATPEQLIKADKKTIHTVALAGTQLYEKDKDTVWNLKEKQEQQIITDYIAGELSAYSGNIILSKPYTYRAGNLVHIKTDVEATLSENIKLEEVINQLHPTPAVCGFPKARAMQFISENENYDREYYSGYLGELNFDCATNTTNVTDLYVNLRCMKIDDESAELFIGCGITADSDPEKEFFETVNKSITMLKVLM